MKAESDESKGNPDKLGSPMLFNHFYNQIKLTPKLLEKASRIDSTLLQHFHDLRAHASAFINEIKKEKEGLLSEFNGWLRPAAKEVIEEIYHDAEKLKDNLNEAISGEESLKKEEWSRHAQRWAKLYSDLQDRQGLVKKVITVASERVKASIHDDIQFIQEYHQHTLSRVDQNSSQNIQKRLGKAIQGAILELSALEKDLPESTNVTQTAAWIANIHQKRTQCSDNILMKIDAVIKKEMHVEELHSVETETELEHEITFMEQEIADLEIQLKRKHADAQSRSLTLDHLQGLQEHLSEIGKLRMPRGLRDRIERIGKRLGELTD